LLWIIKNSATYSDKKPQDGQIKSEQGAAYFQNEGPDISRMRNIVQLDIMSKRSR